MSIIKDRKNFDRKVREAREKKLREFVRTGEIQGRKRGEKFVFPVPIIDLPRFKYGSKEDAGGEGDGEGQPQEGDDAGEAGEQEGDHVLEEVSLDELAELMAEELELPNIEPKGNNRIVQYDDVLRSISRVGSSSRLDKRRSFKKALKRNIVQSGAGRRALEGTVQQLSRQRERVIIAPQDELYRSFKTITTPEMNAVIIYMMDVSGSMGQEQKDLVRHAAFWIDLWLSHEYDGLESKYIIHDASAKLVDRDTFYTTRESGGTLISSAYDLARDLIAKEYPVDEWNIYLLHFSDGDNWSGNDTEKTFEIVDDLLPIVNMIGYGQVDSDFGSGKFFKDLKKKYGMDHEKVIMAEIMNRKKIMPAIKILLGKGR